MLCETAREQLNTLSDGERLETVQQKILLWRHCARCPACRAARRQLKQMRQTARHLPALLPASLCGRILSQLPAEILLSEILPSNDSAFTSRASR